MKALATLVLLAGVVVAVTVAPAHAIATVSNRQSAADARKAWRERQREVARFEEGGDHVVRIRRQLDASVRASIRRAAKVSALYTPIATKPVDAWATSGYCSDQIRANDEVLSEANRAATQEGVQSVIDATGVKSAAKKGVVALTGLQRQAAQLAKFKQSYKAAMDFDAFLTALLTCSKQPDLSVHGCFAVVLEKASREAKKWLGATAEGVMGAIERVEKASAFLQIYTSNLLTQIQKQAIASLKCR